MEKTSYIRKFILIVFFFLMAIHRAFFAFGIRGVDCASNWLTPTAPCTWGNAVYEIFFWLALLVLFLFELHWDHAFKSFWSTCCHFWPVFVFVLWAALSSIWSVLFTITLYKVFVLLMTTVIGIYVGNLLGVKRLLDALFCFFTLIGIAVFVFVLLCPHYGIMANPFYHGAWNGLFWHRNYLGCFMAMAIAVALLRLLGWRDLSFFSKIITLFVLALSFSLLVEAKSATGIFTAIFLVAVCLLAYIWIKWGTYFKPIHYYIVLAVVIVGIAGVLTHLEFFFGLLDRSSSLTGRVPMWAYVFQNVVRKRILIGYGYSAIWNFEGFRNGLSRILNWGTPIMIGDNGFIDIWLHVGLIGLVILAGLIVWGLIRAVRFFIEQKTVYSLLPLVMLMFLLVANISLSLILESETFVWAIVLSSQTAIKFSSQK